MKVVTLRPAAFGDMLERVPAIPKADDAVGDLGGLRKPVPEGIEGHHEWGDREALTFVPSESIATE